MISTIRNKIKGTIEKTVFYFKNPSAFLRDMRPFIKKARWTRLDTYIFKRFITAFLGALFFFTLIYLMSQFVQELRWMPPDVKMDQLLHHYILISGYFILIFQPVAFLFAVVFVLTNLSRHKELVAILSTGTSIFRATFYIIVFTVSYFFFWVLLFQNSVIFPAYQAGLIKKEILVYKLDPKTIDLKKNNNNFTIFGKNQLLYIVGSFNAMTRELDGITIVQFKDSIPRAKDLMRNELETNWMATNAQELTRIRKIVFPDRLNISMRIDAAHAVWDPKQKTWIFKNGMIRHVVDGGSTFRVEPFATRSFDFVTDPPQYFEKTWYNMDAMTYEEGLREIEKLRTTGQDYREALARFYSKISYNLGILFVILAGIGIVDPSKRKTSFVINLMYVTVIFLAYYLLFSMGIALSGKGEIPPLIGAFMGTSLFAVFSIIIYRKSKT